MLIHRRRGNLSSLHRTYLLELREEREKSHDVNASKRNAKGTELLDGYVFITSLSCLSSTLGHFESDEN